MHPPCTVPKRRLWVRYLPESTCRRPTATDRHFDDTPQECSPVWEDEAVELTTFRVTASTGSWRTLPWPFGLVDVSDGQLCIRSFGWSWWVSDRCVDREQVQSITRRKIMGAARFSVAVENAPSITLRTSTSVNQLTDCLRLHGYPVDGVAT